MSAISLRGWLEIPKSMIACVDECRRSLTFMPKQLGDEPPVPIRMFAEDENTLSVPPCWDFRDFLLPEHSTKIADNTVIGEPFVSPCNKPDHNHPAVLDPRAQIEFMGALEHKVAAGLSEFTAFRAKAMTGTGKTVCAAWLAGGVLKRKTLVLSHRKRINDQWVDTFNRILGVPLERIGMVGDGRSDWQNKDVVVATLQSVALKPHSLPEEFYNSFGVVIYDETHVVGATKFSQSAWQFPARVRIGLSATHHRKDGAETVIHAFLGDIDVQSKSSTLPIKIYPVWYNTRHRLWGDNHGARTKCIALDDDRNRLLILLIKRMYDAGNHIIAVGEKITHIERLIEGCVAAGIPRPDIGQFTAYKNYSALQTAGTRNQLTKKPKLQKAHDLDRMKQGCRLLFGTYGMLKEGVDIPRLNAGIDLSPRADAEQLIGRLRRVFPGKTEAFWVTPVDRKAGWALGYYKSRLREYERCGAQIMQGVYV